MAGSKAEFGRKGMNSVCLELTWPFWNFPQLILSIDAIVATGTGAGAGTGTGTAAVAAVTLLLLPANYLLFPTN